MRHAELSLPAAASSVSEARRYVARTLADWDAGAAEWTAAQVVSELVTNAVIHAGTRFTLALLLTDESVRIEVSDADPTSPRTRSYGATATTGRGLRLVAALSRTWGVTPQPAGKTVWCELLRDGDPLSAWDDDVELDAIDGLSQPARSESPDARARGWVRPAGQHLVTLRRRVAA